MTTSSETITRQEAARRVREQLTLKENVRRALTRPSNRPMNPRFPRADVPLLREMVLWAEEEELRRENHIELPDDSPVKEWYQGTWMHLDVGKINGHAQLVPYQRGGKTIGQVITVPDFCTSAYCIAGRVTIQEGWHPVLELNDQNDLAFSLLREGNTERFLDRLMEMVWESEDSYLGRDPTRRTVRKNLYAYKVRDPRTGNVDSIERVAARRLMGGLLEGEEYVPDGNGAVRDIDPIVSPPWIPSEINDLFRAGNRAKDIRYYAEDIAGQEL